MKRQVSKARNVTTFKIFISVYYLLLSMYVSIKHMYVTVQVQQLEDKSVEPLLLLHLDANSRDWVHVIGFTQEVILSAELSCWPSIGLFYIIL